MTTIDQTFSMNRSVPTLTEIGLAIQDIAHRTNSTVSISNTPSGLLINGKSLAELSSSSAGSTIIPSNVSNDVKTNNSVQDRVEFSPEALATMSNQEVALNVIDSSQEKTYENKDNQLVNLSHIPVTKSIDTNSTVPFSESSDEIEYSENPVNSLKDLASLLTAYSSQSFKDRF